MEHDNRRKKAIIIAVILVAAVLLYVGLRQFRADRPARKALQPLTDEERTEILARIKEISGGAANLTQDEREAILLKTKPGNPGLNETERNELLNQL